MRGRYVLHPLFFAAYPIVLLFSLNMRKVAGIEVAGALGLAALLAAILMGLSWSFLRDARKAAILTSLLMFYFFFFRWASTPVRVPGFSLSHRQTLALLLPLHGLVFAIVIVWLIRAKEAVRDVTHILNVVGGFFLATSLLPLLTGLRPTIVAEAAPPPPAPAEGMIVARSPLPYLPDIYFIVLDQYPRADGLQQVFGHDNSPFLGELRKLGFTVLDRCASNYPRTAMSIASTLNLNYLDVLLGKVREDAQDLGLPAKFISHSLAFDYARERGYKTVYLPPDFGVGTPANADIVLDSGSRLSEFQRALIAMTPVQDFVDAAASEYSPAEFHRRHVRYMIEQLRRVPRLGASPMLVYAHIICPHPPIVFGADGEAVDALLADNPPANWARDPEVRAAYVNQVVFMSREALRIVRAILERSPRPPVIVLCSDHGTDFEVDWQRPEHSKLQERMANLQAYYLPGGGEKLLYPTMTNVNIFRLIFSYYLGGNFPLLPDRSYFSPDGAPYRFVHVPMDGPVPPLPGANPGEVSGAAK